MTPDQLKINGRYNWQGQPERLIYIGKDVSQRWYQFALVEEPDEVWCEVQAWQLGSFEETPDTAHRKRIQPVQDVKPKRLKGLKPKRLKGLDRNSTLSPRQQKKISKALKRQLKVKDTP